MKIIVDSNIVFSSLLNQYSLLCDTLLDKQLEFFMPKYTYIELFKYKEKIMKFSKHGEDEVLEILYKLLKNIVTFDEELITADTLKTAHELVSDIDEKDLIFIALTIELDGLLWTRDKKLVEGLKEKGFKKFFEFENFVKNRKQ